MLSISTHQRTRIGKVFFVFLSKEIILDNTINYLICNKLKSTLGDFEVNLESLNFEPLLLLLQKRNQFLRGATAVTDFVFLGCAKL